MRWLIRNVAPVGLAGAVLACSSPTGPGPCRNGVDGIGRGPTNSYNMTCTYTGADTFQCTSTLRQVGYCAEPGLRDITAMSEWFTSDPSVATFVSAGVLKVTGAGHVQVGAKYRIDLISTDYVYMVAPGTTPERLVKLSVIVQDTASTPRRLPDASVHIEPDRGAAQSCITDRVGLCQFWVLDGRVRARATLQQYESAEGVSARAWADNPLYQNVTLSLRRLR